jgi:hypothetical protein
MGAVDETLARWIVDLMCVVKQPVAAAVIRGVSEWNGRDLFALCDLPVLLLQASLEEDSEVVRLREIKPDLAVGITVGPATSTSWRCRTR